MDDYDPLTLSRRHYRECLWLRDTLESVARELELGTRSTCSN